MIRNYLITAWRNIRKNKLHSSINFIGLATAFTCSIFILLIVYYQFSYDNFQQNKDKLYKIYTFQIGPNGEELNTAMPYALAPTLKSENIGIENVTNILNAGRLVRYKDKTLDMRTTLVDEDFLRMFSFPVLQGDTYNPLSSVSNVVLTKRSADNIFGKEDPIGKSIEVKIGNKWQKLMVTAVVKDVPDNSTIKFSLLARTELYPPYPEMLKTWDSRNHSVYVQLANNTTSQSVQNRLRSLIQKHNPTDTDVAKRNGFKPDRNGDYFSLRLLPFSIEHFTPHLSESGGIPKTILYVLMLISIMIILIASFNFINLNIGLSFTRTKEIGIRKCLGAGKRQIWMQVWGESLFMVLFSALVAAASVAVLIKGFNQMFNAKLSLGLLIKPIPLIVLAALVLLVSFIASGFPSRVMARLKTVDILKGKITIKKPGILRSALIVTQFVIAIVLLCSTVIIFQQFDYLRSAPLGYNTQSIISIPIKDNDAGKEIVSKLRTRLSDQSSVISVTGTDTNLGMGEDQSSSTSVTCFTFGESIICGQTITADYDFLKTLGIKPTSGRDFSLDYASDTGFQVIATKSYADQFGGKGVAGFSYYADSAGPKINIVGIIPDIQIKALTDQQKPVTIFLNQGGKMSYALVKVSTSNPVAAMDIVKKAYLSVEPGTEFKGSFVNENIDRLYKDENMMANVFTIAALITIILSCMGLFGIASIIIRQRIKEIGVRKVLGASVGNIFTIVNREFLKPVIVAFLIAVPLCWWAMSAWLQNYTHRITIHWWIFVVIGLSAFVITIFTVSVHSIRAALANPVDSLRTE
ncbi:MAG: ABC transporter permease [Chitinophagaceae bacterium]|nr:ABC transporter permease [Chitinophagaceae bacterium]